MAQFTLEESVPPSDTPDGEKKEYKVIPAGKYLAEILDVEVRDGFFWVDVEDHSKGKQKKVNFKFAVDEDGEWKNWKVFGDTPTTFNNHENCKLRRWVEEIFAYDDLPAGFKLDTSDLIGQPVYMIVAHKTYNDKTTGQPVTKAFVENLVRYTGGYEETSEQAF